MQIQQKVASFIKEYSLVEDGAKIVAGISGGADSVALLHILLALAPQMNFSVYAAHLNHGIRGESAYSDAEFVEDLCEFYGVPFIGGHADVPSLAKQRGETLEQAGRVVRYEFLESARKKFDADAIAVAHHMDDQAESVLLHLTRGTGLLGLTGMQPKRSNIIRPLLMLRRQELEEYLHEQELSYHTDETNVERNGTRNRLRLDVIPYIEEHINSAIVPALCSMSELLLWDEEYLTRTAREALKNAKCEIGYDRKMLKKLELPILSRAIRLALFDAGAIADIERVHVENVIAFLSARTGATLQLPHVEAWISYDLICFGHSEAVEEFELPFNMRGETITPLGTFIAEEVDASEFAPDPCTAFFDADMLEGGLAVRTRKSGDRFHPIGAPGRRKLKDFFIDRKVPREKRILPLIAQGNEVLFVPGHCIANNVKITEKTTRVLRVKYLDIKLYDR